MQVSSRQTEIADHLRNQNQSMNEALLKQILANKDSMIASLANQQVTRANCKAVMSPISISLYKKQ